MAAVAIDRRARWRLPVAAVFAAALVLQIARVRLSEDPFNQVYGEDGVFYQEAVEHGPASLLRTYGGYAHLMPRVLALLGSWLPIEGFAAYSRLAAFVTVALITSFVFAAARVVTRSEWWPLLAAVAVVLAPALRWEGLGAISNLQFFLVPATMWALLIPRRRGALAWLAPLVALVAALSSVLTLFPFLAAVVLQRRRITTLPAAWACAVGLACHLLMMWLSPGIPAMHVIRDPWMPPLDLLEWFLHGSAGSATFLPPGQLVGIFVLAAVVGIVLTSMDRRPLVITGTAVLSFVFASQYTGAAEFRYSAMASMLLATALTLALIEPRDHRVKAAVVAILTASAAISFPTRYDYYQHATPWDEQARNFREICSTGAASAPIAMYPTQWWAPIPVRCPPS